MTTSIFPTVDVDRMIKALSTNASDFGLDGSWLQHRPTRHRFKFAKDGRLMLIMSYGLFFVWVSREQKIKLSEAFTTWKEDYWSAHAEFGKRMRRRGDAEYMWQRGPAEYTWQRDEFDYIHLKDTAMMLAVMLLSFLFLMAENQVIRHFRGPSQAAVAEVPFNQAGGPRR